MHKGVQRFIAWIRENPHFPDLVPNPPATAADLAIVEDAIASPLPIDLRLVLGRHNGGRFPSGQLLSAGQSDDNSMGRTLSELADRLRRPVRDPELYLPFFRSNDGGLLAFDRSAGPVSDTWPIVDYYIDSGEVRLVYRTFDGWCRWCIATWTDADFHAPFTLEKYLADGLRHVDVEPDVSTAHATVAHAYRRAGQPEQALASYLRAARCVPAQPWCDWEALKIAALLSDTKSAMEAVNRLAARAPERRWNERETTPSLVADVLGRIAPSMFPKEALLRLFDQLAEQITDQGSRKHVAAIRRAIHGATSPPPTMPLRPTAVEPDDDKDNDAWFSRLQKAYEEGRVRDDDLLLDPAYEPLRRTHDMGLILCIARGF